MFISLIFRSRIAVYILDAHEGIFLAFDFEVESLAKKGVSLLLLTGLVIGIFIGLDG